MLLSTDVGHHCRRNGGQCSQLEQSWPPRARMVVHSDFPFSAQLCIAHSNHLIIIRLPCGRIDGYVPSHRHSRFVPKRNKNVPQRTAVTAALLFLSHSLVHCGRWPICCSSAATALALTKLLCVLGYSW